MRNTEPEIVQVAAAVIIDHRGCCLISRRHDHLHQGGLWEFPGGKLESGESATAALQREIAEELGLEVVDSEHFMRVEHRYTDKHVCLEFFKVSEYRGQAHSTDGQPLRWVPVQDLSNYHFPEANQPVVECLQDEGQAS